MGVAIAMEKCLHIVSYGVMLQGQVLQQVQVNSALEIKWISHICNV